MKHAHARIGLRDTAHHVGGAVAQAEIGARRLGLDFIPSYGNFLTIRVGKAFVSERGARGNRAQGHPDHARLEGVQVALKLLPLRGVELSREPQKAERPVVAVAPDGTALWWGEEPTSDATAGVIVGGSGEARSSNSCLSSGCSVTSEGPVSNRKVPRDVVFLDDARRALTGA